MSVYHPYTRTPFYMQSSIGIITPYSYSSKGSIGPSIDRSINQPIHHHPVIRPETPISTRDIIRDGDLAKMKKKGKEGLEGGERARRRGGGYNIFFFDPCCASRSLLGLQVFSFWFFFLLFARRWALPGIELDFSIFLEDTQQHRSYYERLS